jgi:hypothetical protein
MKMTTVNVDAVWRARDVLSVAANEVRMQEWKEKWRFIPKFHTLEYRTFDNKGEWEVHCKTGTSSPELTD